MSFYCKNCGTELNVDGQKIAVCDFCGMEQTLPTADDPKKLELFAKANEYRIASRFDLAKKQYESIIAQYPDDNEAYWCKLLCTYGIEYVEDDLTEKKIPTCHRTVTESIFDNSEYKLIMSRATAEEKAIYESEAKEIDRIQKEILAKADKEEPYDIFICYKESENDSKKRTVDAQYATKIYTYFTEHGYKVFFSRITLKNKLGSEYEPVIYSALKSAKVMLHVTTSIEHTNAPWVRNEWSRFLEFMNSDVTKTILPCIAQMGPYELPEELSKFQVADMTDLDFLENLARQIDNKFGKFDTVSTTRVEENVTNSVENVGLNMAQLYLNRIEVFLEENEWDKVNEYAEKILDINPKSCQAYLLKLFAEYEVKSITDLAECEDILTNNNFLKAKKYADKDSVAQIKVVEDKVQELQNEKNYNLALTLFRFDLIKEENYKNLKECLIKLGNYKDAKQLLESLPTKRQKQIEDAELVKKQSSYTSALHFLSFEPNDYNYQKAKTFLEEVGDYQDAKKLFAELESKRKAYLESLRKKKIAKTSILVGIIVIIVLAIIAIIVSVSLDMAARDGLKMTLSSNGDYYVVTGIDQEKSSYKIPSTYQGKPVKEIGNNAFYGCSSLTSIEISDSVTSIGNFAFRDCSSLTSIKIPDSVTSIGKEVFRFCSSLTSIEIPDSVTSIGEYAFQYCSKLTIYCEAASKPSGWSSYWNNSNRPVVWGYKGE
ncbi:MAG: leucine-rich repeat protein [Clostridia bacterium]|nr:leucine-rich repeat protein [Clostridia bacterium]